MTASSFRLEVSYGQLAVFSRNLSQPFNDWTERHVAQGFAWRPGSASFRTIAESGTHAIEVEVTDHVTPVSPDAVRAVEVPFEVPQGGAIEIASISDSKPLVLPAGSYALRCEFMGPGKDGNQRVRIAFARSDLPRFKVHRADRGLAPGDVLLMTAEPAAL